MSSDPYGDPVEYVKQAAIDAAAWGCAGLLCILGYVVNHPAGALLALLGLLVAMGRLYLIYIDVQIKREQYRQLVSRGR